MKYLKQRDSITKLNKKLNSSSGASLSIALIVFLVCSVIGAIILSSAMATVGRMSDMKEADTRYYSVYSAANVLKKTLSGQCYMVKRTESVKTTTTSEYRTVDHVVEELSSDEDVEKTYNAMIDLSYDGTTFNGEQVTLLTKDESLLATSVMNLVFGDLGVYTSSGAYEAELPAFTGEKTRQMNISLTSSSLTSQAKTNLKVLITETLTNDGLLKLKLTSADGGKDKYSITLVFEAEWSDVERTVDKGIVYAENVTDPSDESLSTSVEIGEVLNTRETEIKWNFLRMEDE